MANFFSADYWRALYFRTLSGGASEEQPGAMSARLSGSSTFRATLSVGAQYPSQDFRNVLDGHSEDYWLRKRARERAEHQRIYDERIAALELELKEAEVSLAVIETAPAVSKAVMSHDATAEAARLAEMARQEEDELLILLLAA